jgi:uncharacterized protein YfaS (alpha-2-macroglobulin family)
MRGVLSTLSPPAIFQALLVCLAISLTAAESPNESQGVQLILGAPEISPTTTFELRFDEAMVSPERRGIPAEKSPLVITPPLPGSFTWLSQRSGVFTPSAPLALGTTYQLRLAPALKTAVGQASDAKLMAQVTTPPMQVTGQSPEAFSANDAPSSPEIIVQFNARVKPNTVARFIDFEDAAGQKISALTKPATEDDGYFPGPADAQKAWRDRFQSSPDSSAKVEFAEEKKSAAPVPNRVTIRPAQPLPPGEGWRCILKKGLPASDGPERLPGDHEIKIGKVRPFAVENVEAHNTIESGRWIRIGFTKSISPLIKVADAPQWVSVTPAPANLKFDRDDSAFAIHGDFQLDQRYTVTVNQGLPAEEPFTLAATYTKETAFVPIPPRLYFPALTTEQLSGGRRTFELQSINLPTALVRARLLDPQSIVYALAGYRGGYAKKRNSDEEDDHEPYGGVTFDLVPGKTIFQETIETNTPRDQTSIIPLSWDRILSGRRTGAVFLDASGVLGQPGENPKTVGTQAIVQLTDLGLVWKFNGTDAWVYVFSQETGLPVANATVRCLTNENETLLTSKTSAAGIAFFHRDKRSQWLMAEAGEDFHVVEFGPHPLTNVPLYAFKIPYGYWEPRNLQPVFLFSDRPLYQPGESLHLKGIVRELSEKGLALPEPFSFQLRLNDPDDQKIWQAQATLSPEGTFTADIPIPEGRLGSYTAIADFGNRSTRSLSVSVQEYKPAPFEIALQAKESYAADEVVRADVSAKYFHGKPLTNALVKWSLEGRDTNFNPDGFDQFTFGPQSEEQGEEAEAATKLAEHGDLHLDDKGTATIAPEVSTNPAQPQPRRCRLLVEITDLGQTTISQRHTFVRQSSAFYLGLQRPDDVVIAGKPFPIRLVAVQPDGTPRSQPAEGRVVIEKRNFHTVREQGAGGTLNYRTETNYVSAFDKSLATLPLLKSEERWEIAPSASAAQFTPNDVGSYRLRALAKDEGGHPIESSFDFSVSAEEPKKTDWDYRNEAQIDLVPDKKSYAPGEEAKILVKTPISGAALVTVEQDRVRRAFLTKLAGNAPVVRVPLEATDAPNVFVSVLELRGRAQSPRQIKTPDYRIGYAQLNVVRPETRLAVGLESSDRAYRPGAEVSTIVTVKTSGGRAVANADIALFAVDEGVLTLMSYKAPDPYGFFYDTQPLRVQTGLTLPNLFPEDASALEFSNKGFLVGGGGDESGPSALRKNFLGTAFWKADLRTGKDGRAQARFSAPDNLTRFRLIAVVNAGADRFGSAESSFEVNKPLMLEPSLPAFATVGDKLVARAILQNRSDQTGEAEITLQLDDKTKEQTKLATRLTIAPRGSQAVDFPVEFQNPGNAHWVWTARLNGLSDAVESNLPVGLAAPLLREILTDHTQATESNLLAKANPQFLEGTGHFQVNVANTRLLGLVEPVAYLLHYPYGCAEQTISNMLPWIVAPQLRNAVPELRVPNDKASRAIATGITRLLEMQADNGGIGFWPHDREPNLWASAYAGVALALAQRNGWEVPASTLSRLCDYLSGALRDSGDLQENFELSDRCLALYALALAGRPENSYHEVLFNKRTHLSAESRALLALAILESHGPETMVEQLINPHESMEAQGDVYFGGAERELAVRLLAWSQFRPNDHEVDVLVEELLRSQREGRWGNTQSNAWALLGLTKYASQLETGEKQASGYVDYAGKRHPFQLDEEIRTFAEARPIAKANPAATPVPLLLGNPQARTLFTQVKLEARPPVGLQPRQDRGFMLQRSYQKVNDDGSLTKAESLGVGDRVLVTLKLEVRQPAHFVAVDDALPAVFEAVNPEFKTQEMRDVSSARDNWYSDYLELRHDRALFFRNHLAPGSYTITYLARVRAAGEVIAPPAKIEEMYHPDRFGLSEAVKVKSTALQ